MSTNEYVIQVLTRTRTFFNHLVFSDDVWADDEYRLQGITIIVINLRLTSQNEKFP